MKAFIRAAEIWIPTREGIQLRFAEGLYGALGDFRLHREQMRYRWNEGLPGKTWAAGRPILLKELEDPYFQGIDAAKAAGLTCAIALPICAGEFVLAVLVLLCGDDEAHVGVIELWHNDP